MNKIFLPLLLLLNLSFTCFSQKENSIFWQVVSPNKKDTSYLFGTIHMLPKDQFVLPDTVKECLIRSKAAYFELDLNTPQAEIMAASKLPEGQSLFDFVTAEQKDSLFAYGEAQMGVDSVMFSFAISPFKPFIFTQLPLYDFMLNSIGYDDILQQISRENQIEIKALETHLEQIAIFDNMPKNLVNQMIMDVVRQTTNPEEQLKETQEMYLNQDLPSFLKEFETETEMNAYMLTHLIQERNVNWVNRLKKEMKNKKCFVAVGAGHLAGDKGLIQLLRNEKYILTPIQIDLK